MDSLKRQRLRQLLLIGLATGSLAALVTVNALRPSREEQAVRDVSQSILAVDWERTTPAAREQYRQQWDRLSPATREQVWVEVSRARLRELRAQTAALTPDERARRLQTEIARLRERHGQLTDTEKQQLRERLQAPDGQRLMRRIMSFYQTELTAKERAELDPLVHEWFYQLEELAR